MTMEETITQSSQEVAITHIPSTLLQAMVGYLIHEIRIVLDGEYSLLEFPDSVGLPSFSFFSKTMGRELVAKAVFFSMHNATALNPFGSIEFDLFLEEEDEKPSRVAVGIVLPLTVADDRITYHYSTVTICGSDPVFQKEVSGMISVAFEHPTTRLVISGSLDAAVRQVTRSSMKIIHAEMKNSGLEIIAVPCAEYVTARAAPNVCF